MGKLVGLITHNHQDWFEDNNSCIQKYQLHQALLNNLFSIFKKEAFSTAMRVAQSELHDLQDKWLSKQLMLSRPTQRGREGHEELLQGSQGCLQSHFVWVIPHSSVQMEKHWSWTKRRYLNTEQNTSAVYSNDHQQSMKKPLQDYHKTQSGRSTN